MLARACGPLPLRRAAALAVPALGCAASASSAADSFVVAARVLPDDLASGDRTKGLGPRTGPELLYCVVGATGFEPVTASVSANHQGTAVRTAVFPGRARP